MVASKLQCQQIESITYVRRSVLSWTLPLWTDVSASSGPYFLQQTVSNACGTVALIHAYAAHAATAGVASDGWLGSFVGRTAGKTSVERAACLEDDEALAVSHNDMARQVKERTLLTVATFLSAPCTQFSQFCGRASLIAC